MARLNIERQNELEPGRIEYCKNEIQKLGYEIIYETNVYIQFMFKGHKITLYPYSGWHTGKSIKDGRGIQKLIEKISSSLGEDAGQNFVERLKFRLGKAYVLKMEELGVNLHLVKLREDLVF